LPELICQNELAVIITKQIARERNYNNNIKRIARTHFPERFYKNWNANSNHSQIARTKFLEQILTNENANTLIAIFKNAPSQI
jgi:hypothetical protein